MILIACFVLGIILTIGVQVIITPLLHLLQTPDNIIEGP